MVGCVEQFHGTRVDEIGCGCTKRGADEGRVLFELGLGLGVRSIELLRKTRYQQTVGSNLNLEANRIISSRCTDCGNEHLGISHQNIGN